MMDAGVMGSHFAFSSPHYSSAPMPPGTTNSSNGGGSSSSNNSECSLHYQSCNHGDTLTENILELFRGRAFCDLVVVAGHTRIPVHRLVLVACSSYFRDLLHACPPPPAHTGGAVKGGEGPGGPKGAPIPEIEIADVDGEAALKVIEFFYSAAISLTEENVWGILPVACMFQVEEVCTVCCDYLIEQLSVSTCLPTLRLALQCSCQDLQAKAANFIRKHFDELVGRREFEELPLDAMLAQLKCLQLDVVSDRQLLRGLKAWVNVQPELRRLSAPQIANQFPDLVPQMKDFLPPELFKPVFEDRVPRASPSSKPDDSPHTSTTTTSDYSTDHEAAAAAQSAATVPSRPIVCQSCGEVLPRPEDIPAHMAECLKSPASLAPGLPKSMMYPPALLGHSREGSPATEEGGPAATNGVVLGGLGTWLQCHVCGQSFANQRSLQRHAKIHSSSSSGGGDGRFSCQICGKDFSTRSNLQGHMKLHGAAGQRARLYQCEDCGQSFDSFCVLKVHRRSHTSVRPFPCPTCGVSFAKNIHLKRHLAIHTGVKPHQCRICQKFFSRSDHLKRHIQSIHSGAKPHSCHLCHKNFVRKYELNKHLRQHFDNTLVDSGPSSPASSLAANESFANGGSPPPLEVDTSSPLGAADSPASLGQVTVKMEASRD